MTGSDFKALASSESMRGMFNVHIPDGWYMHVCSELDRLMPGLLQFRFFTDHGGPEYERLLQRFHPGQMRQRGLTECSDLLLMAQADLRVCSVSSYSMAATFLSDGPYLWYEAQLYKHDDSYSLWGHEEAQQAPDSLTRRSEEFVAGLSNELTWQENFKGYAMSSNSAVPQGLILQLRRKLQSKERRTNLLEYGCLPTWSVGASPST